MKKIISKLIVVLTISFATPLISISQTHKFELGAITGTNYSILISKNDRFQEPTYLPGFNVGASFQYNLNQKISFRSSVFLEQHYSRYSIPSGQSYLHPYNNEYVRYTIFKSNNATLNLSARYFFGQKTKFFIDGGFQFSRFYEYQTITITDNDGKIKEHYKPVDPTNAFRFVLSPGISIPLGNKMTMTYELSGATQLNKINSNRYLNLFFMGGIAYNLGSKATDK